MNIKRKCEGYIFVTVLLTSCILCFDIFNMIIFKNVVSAFFGGISMGAGLFLMGYSISDYLKLRG